MRDISKNARALIASALCRTWVLHGRLKNCEHDLTLLYGGHKEHFSYIRKLLFQGDEDCRYLGRRAIWNFSTMGRSLGAQLALVPGCESLRCFYPREAGFFVPWWVAGEISTEIDYTSPPWRSRLSGDLRRLRKARYRSIVSSRPRDVRHFYDTMYRPLIERSHGEGALPMGLEEMLAHIRAGGELIFTLDGDELVAGELVVYEKNRALSRAIGVKEADQALIKKGVMAASTFNTIHHVREKGLTRLHLGGSRAFLTDGLLRYKNKWGLKLVGHDKHGHFLRVLELSRGVRALLARTPFIYIRNGQRWGASFEDAETSDSTASETRARSMMMDGLRGITVHRMGPAIRSMEAPTEVLAKRGRGFFEQSRNCVFSTALNNRRR